MMDWGSVIASAIGGGATGLIGAMDQADKERQASELATLKGQMQMDRLLQSIEGKYQTAMAINDAKIEAALAKSGGGSRSTKAGGLLDMTPEQEVAAAEYFGVRRKPTDRSAFETTTKEADPLSRMSPEEEQEAIATGGDVGDALSRKTGGIVQTTLDEKGYNSAEYKRIEDNIRTQIALTNPSALDNLSKSKADDLVRQVTELAIKNPKLNVGELYDRLGLLKPGDKRVAVDKDGNRYNEHTGADVGEQRAPMDKKTIQNEIDVLKQQRIGLDNAATQIRRLMEIEMKDLSVPARQRVSAKYQTKLDAIDKEQEELKIEIKTLQSRLSSKAASTTGGGAKQSSITTPMPSAAPNPRSVIDAIRSKQ